jgi:large subunit ribosomal protein L25
VRRGEKVTIEVPVTTVGEVAPGALLQTELTTLTVEAEATHLPTGFEVSVDGLEPGSHVTASRVPLPDGTSLITDPDAVVFVVSEAPSAEQLEAQVAEAAGELGIVEEQPAEAAEEAAAAPAAGQPAE